MSGEGKSLETVDGAKDMILNAEPERFENDVQDEDESKFNLKLIIFKQ